MRAAIVIPGVDLQDLLRAVGYIGLFAIVFAESGLLIGFFLPGDSLLFTAGFLAYAEIGNARLFDIQILLPLVAVAAITGDSVGYAFGSRVGRRLFQREDSFWFRRKHLETASAFYEKHGGKTLILARFLPIVRTFAPIVAGMGHMNYGRFLFYNVLGGLLWTFSMIGGGYLFGQSLEALGIGPKEVDRYLIIVIGGIIVISIAPTVLHLYKENRVTIHRMVRERSIRPTSVD